MNNKLFCAIVIVFVELFAASNAHAIFPRRFGCSGGCAPVVHHAAPVVVQQQRDILQNFFIGLAPTQLDSPRGSTFYARDLASEVVLASDKDYLNFGTLLANGAGDALATARSVRPGLEAIATRNADANLTLAKGEAAANVIRSLSTDTSGTAKTVVLTLRNGKVDAFQELQATPAEAPVDPAPVPRGPIVGGNICLKCHAAGGSASEKFVIDDTYDLTKHMLAEDAINAGRMPPKSNLSPAEKATIRLQLGKLVP